MASFTTAISPLSFPCRNLRLCFRPPLLHAGIGVSSNSDLQAQLSLRRLKLSFHPLTLLKATGAGGNIPMDGVCGGGDESSGTGKGRGGDESGSRGEGEGDGKTKAMSMSQKLTLAYGALLGIGGVMGYMKSGSQNSLAAGGFSSLLLYYVYTALPTKPVVASSLGLGVSAALLSVMGSRFMQSGKIFPPGVVALLSLVMTAGYFHGLLRTLH